MKKNQLIELPAYEAVTQKYTAFHKYDLLDISLTQLFNLAASGWPINFISDSEFDFQLQEIRKDLATLAYFHILVHAACHYTISKKGKFDRAVMHSHSKDEFVFPNLTGISEQLNIGPEILQALYQGKGTPDNVFNLLRWYNNQLPDFGFSDFFTYGVLIEHTYRIAREDRQRLTLNHDKLLASLSCR